MTILSNFKVPKIPLLSFFTGAGFLDMGFLKNGFDIIWHNEYDDAFAHGFEYGMRSLFPSASTHAVKVQNRSPIQELSSKQILNEAFNGAGCPDTFGMIGGPPCPDFSNAGKHRGIDGSNGKLSEVYVSTILDLQPTFFLFENVPGMVKTRKNRIFLANLMARLSTSYFLDVELLNALEFGAPQDRNRLFIIGIHRHWANTNIETGRVTQPQDWMPRIEVMRQQRLRAQSNGHRYRQLSFDATNKWFPWPSRKLFLGAKARYDWPTTSPFGGNPQKPIGIPDELMVWSWIKDSTKLESLPNGIDFFHPYSEKFNLICEGDVSGKSFKRLHRWRYSPPAAYGNNEVHLHPTQPRRLTVREALCIQTVPESYALPATMTLTQKFKTITNGVPVNLSSALAESLAQFLSGQIATTPKSH